jgi:hypothetical protein
LFTILVSGLNMRKEAFIAPLLCLLMFAGFASAQSTLPCPVPGSYTASVLLTGTIQLGWYNWTSKTFETYNLTGINSTFAAMVPTGITPGQYNNAAFEGYARVDNASVEFNGYIRVNATSPGFMVSFTVPNNWPQVPKAEFEACGTVETTITKIPLPPITYTWVLAVGQVTKYGNENATGWLNAQAMITNVTQVANVHVLWMPMPRFVSPLGCGVTSWNRNNLTYTYSFYAASLIKTTIAALNYTGYDFYVNGTWTVYNVTFTYSRSFDQSKDTYSTSFDQCKENVTVVKQNATGALEVSGGWKNFTVSITGFNDVKGLVTRAVISHKRILVGDFTGQGYVNILDLVAVARHIGETPGLEQGSCNLQQVEQYDVNFDFHVDIYSLVTVANEIGVSP